MVHNLKDPLDAEYELILGKEVEQHLQFADLIEKKMIYLGNRGDYVYFCFECIVPV